MGDLPGRTLFTGISHVSFVQNYAGMIDMDGKRCYNMAKIINSSNGGNKGVCCAGIGLYYTEFEDARPAVCHGGTTGPPCFRYLEIRVGGKPASDCSRNFDGESAALRSGVF